MSVLNIYMENAHSDTYDLLLSSKSPRRCELLEQIGVRYKMVSVNVVEARKPREAPVDYVTRLALTKARAGAEVDSAYPCLGADTIVVSNGQIMEKPKNEIQGRQMLQALSGMTHSVMTAVSICFGERQLSRVNETQVEFRPILSDEIERYWRTGEPCDKAGGYGIQGLAGVFVKSIRGSYSSVVGLPLYETAQLLQAFEVPLWNVASLGKG